MVRNIWTPLESTRRMCTDDLDINLFMVNHVCMPEGLGEGTCAFVKRMSNMARTREGDMIVIVTVVLITKLNHSSSSAGLS